MEQLNRNHEVIQMELPRLEIFLCRRDVIDSWVCKSQTSRVPYWRLYRAYNDYGYIRYRKETFNLKAGEVWLIAPQTEFDAETRGGKIEKFYVLFQIGGIFEHCAPFCLRLPHHPGLLDLIESAGQRLLCSDCGHVLALECQSLVSLAMSLVPSECLKEYADVDSTLLKVVHLMRQDPARPRDYTELAALAQMSLGSFYRRFEHCFGLSPQKYLLLERLRLASVLLSNSRLSIAEVAQRAGFCDRYYFSRIFAKYQGISPARFRRQTCQDGMPEM